MRMWLTVTVTVTALGALTLGWGCGEREGTGAESTDESWAAFQARWPAPPVAEGESDDLARALKLYAEEADQVEGAFRRAARPSQAVVDLSRYPSAQQAMNALRAWHRAGGRLIGTRCDAPAMSLFGFARTALASASWVGADAQRSASLYLARRLMVDDQALIGAMVGVALLDEARERAEAAGLTPDDAMRAAAPPKDALWRALVGEVACVDEMISAATKDGDHPLHVMADHHERWREHWLDILKDAEPLREQPEAMLRAIRDRMDAALDAKSPLVRATAISSDVFEELGQKIERYRELVGAR